MQLATGSSEPDSCSQTDVGAADCRVQTATAARLEFGGEGAGGCADGVAQDVLGADGGVPDLVAHLGAEPVRELVAQPMELQAHLGVYADAHVVVHHPPLHL